MKNKLLNEFIEDFGISLDLDVVEQNKFLTISDENKNESLFFSGTSIATIDKQIIPSPTLLKLIAEKTQSYIVLDEKVSWLFICGRDIFEQKYIEKGKKLEKKIIIYNQKKEIIGVADKNLNNYWNIGDYLKREK